MDTVPSNPYPLDAEGFEHPRWCDLQLCTAPSSLRARGQDEADVPFTLRDAHLAAPHVVDGARIAEARYTLQAWQMVDRPVDDEVEGVDLQVERLDERLQVVFPVTLEQLAPLARAFGEVRDLVAVGKPPTVVDRAVAALVAFGEFDADVVARLLPMWRRYGELTAADVEAVIGWFTVGGDTPPARIPDPWTARDLRVLFAGHLLVDRLEAELRDAGAADPVTASRWLPTWPHFDELTGREAAAVLARFVPAPAVDERPDGGVR